MRNKNDEYSVLFSGVKLSKYEANKVGISLIFGIFSCLCFIFIFNIHNKLIVFGSSSLLAVFGYFLGNRIFKKSKRSRV